MILMAGFIANYFAYFFLISIKPIEYLNSGIQGILVVVMFILGILVSLIAMIFASVNLISIFSSFSTYEVDFVDKQITFFDTKFFSLIKSPSTKIYFRDINSLERRVYELDETEFRITFVDDIKPPLQLKSLELKILSVLLDVPIEIVYGKWAEESFKSEYEVKLERIISSKKSKIKEFNPEQMNNFHGPNLLDDILFYPILFGFISILYCLLLQFLPFNLSI